MTWRVAKSLLKLRDHINTKFPNRSRVSDGTIGDAAHASRSSDHNPWVKDGKTGVVTAIDFTNDPANGLDSERLAEALIASRDPRIKYIISNKKIAAGFGGPSPWVWRKYSGSNPHSRHMHLSVEDTKNLYDDESSWDIDIKAPVNTPVARAEMPLIRKGSKNEAVRELQQLLNKKGYALAVDGDFGPKTDKAVRLFQRASGLHVDGIVGPYTWDKLKP